jgi:RNA polymerase sigma-70 factor (ECF subfamily)
LRAFLVKVTRNRFLNRCHHASREESRPLTGADEAGCPPTCQPRPNDIAQADELWEQMLTVCPPAHRELLRLKREGFALREIAAHTGLHESSVRRILYDLARRLAANAEKVSSARARPGATRYG